jgi:hypothetical protein
MFKSYWLENNGFTQIEHFYNCFKIYDFDLKLKKNLIMFIFFNFFINIELNIIYYNILYYNEQR